MKFFMNQLNFGTNYTYKYSSGFQLNEVSQIFVTQYLILACIIFCIIYTEKGQANRTEKMSLKTSNTKTNLCLEKNLI